MKRFSVFCLFMGVALMNTVSAEDTGLAFSGEFYGGSIESEDVVSAYGAATVPVVTNFAFHLEALGDELGDDNSRNIGGHLYWRNPDFGLLGIIASRTNFEIAGFDGDFSGLGAEAELYFKPFSIAAQYAELDSDLADIDGDHYRAFDLHWTASNAWYLVVGTRSLRDEDIGYAEVDFTADGGNSPLTLYGGATWNDFESQYLGVDYVVLATKSSSLSIFLEGDTGEDGYDGVFLGIAYNRGPVANAPLISLFENLKGGF